MKAVDLSFAILFVIFKLCTPEFRPNMLDNVSLSSINDQNVQDCHFNCSGHQTLSNATSHYETSTSLTAEPELDPEPYSEDSLPSCKNMTIDPEEYSIDEMDGTLIIGITNVSFSQDNYTLDNDMGASLCYPFTDPFMACLKWLLDKHEYEFRHHGLQLWSKPHKKLYSTGEFFEYEDDKRMVTCTIQSKRRYFNTSAMFGGAWIVSTVSMFVAFAIYLISQNLQKTYTKVVLSHMACLFIFYLFLCIHAFVPVPPILYCAYTGPILHYTFLSSLFWLNVLAFDIWKQFRNIHICHCPIASAFDKSYLTSSIYGWGCPLLIVTIAICVDQTLDSSNFRTNFSSTCWFSTIEAMLLFMYGPAALLLACNVFFFIMTIANLRSFSKDLARVNKKINYQLLITSVKLLVVMGLCWILEVASAFSSPYTGVWYWYPVDMLSSFQGFFIFLVYVCKKNMWHDLKTACQRHHFRYPHLVSNSSSSSTEQSILSQENSNNSSLLTLEMQTFAGPVSTETLCT